MNKTEDTNQINKNQDENNNEDVSDDEEEIKEPSTINELLEFNKIEKITLNELEIENFIAEGGQAKVYKGKLISKNVYVAIKIMYNIDWTCFFREVTILSKLQHSLIPKFYGVLLDQKKGKVIIGMVSEYIKGETLENYDYELIKEELKLPLIKSLAETFEYVHRMNFIHRDLNLANLILGEDFKAHIIDFGIAKITKSSQTYTRAKGTVNFLAPETLIVSNYDEDDMIISEISNKVDIWSFGCILSYLYSGVKPWCNEYKDNPAVIQQNLIKQIEFPIPGIIKENNEKIWEIIKCCTNVKAEKRVSFKEVVVMLNNC